MNSSNRFAAMLLFLAFTLSFAYADAVSDGAEAFSRLPSCFQDCYSVATPLNSTGLNAVCSSFLPGFADGIVACTTKCALPTDNASLQNFTNISTSLGNACQSLASTTTGATFLLIQEITTFPPCFQTCISNTSIPSPEDFCAVVANPSQSPLTDCVRGRCNEVVQTQFSELVGNLTGSNVLGRVCANAKGATLGANATGTAVAGGGATGTNMFGGPMRTGMAGSAGGAKGESNGAVGSAMRVALAVVFTVISFVL